VRWGLKEAQSKARGDEQEPDMRCGTPGASGHVTVTAKRSIRQGACFINPASTRGTFCVLPREVSSVPREVACDRNWLKVEKSRLIAGEKSAEGILRARQHASQVG